MMNDDNYNKKSRSSTNNTNYIDNNNDQKVCEASLGAKSVACSLHALGTPNSIKSHEQMIELHTI